jgi:cysteine-rich repeat protein
MLGPRDRSVPARLRDFVVRAAPVFSLRFVLAGISGLAVEAGCASDPPTTSGTDDGDSTSWSGEATTAGGTGETGGTCELDCGANGTCENDSSGESCACSDGYSGDLCDECAAGYHDDSGACIEDVLCYSTSCSHHGDCLDETGAALCTCHSGYDGAACGTCGTDFFADPDELCDATETCGIWDPCGANGTCADVDNKRECTCANGWDGEFCNECAPGFSGDGNGACIAITDCTSTACNGHGTCDDSGGSAQCSCDAEYTGDWCDGCAAGYHDLGGTCVGDLLCSEFNPCNRGTCDDSDGNITCICDENWAGEYCQLCAPGAHNEFGECELDTLCFSGTCSNAGTCDDSGLELVCVCDEGYTGARCESCAGAYHRDVLGACVADESCTAGDPCGTNGTCTDFEGVLDCACLPGWGGATCDVCAAGYHDDAGSCIPDEVCDPDSCNMHGTCTVPSGLVQCGCDEGYTGDACESCDVGYSDDGNGGCASQCGDGVLAGNEACDDGPANSDTSADACRTDCSLPTCGDGVQDSGEGCDDPGSVPDCTYGLTSCQYCDAQCNALAGTTSYCGDTSIDATNGEDCDDGNAISESCTYGETSCTVCTATCVSGAGATSYCGDGTVDASNSEACDDGAANSDTAPDACRTSCAAATCGDGVQDSGEACDDGAGNGPTQDCYSDCSANVCGDGVKGPSEGCDDNNNVDGDGCSATCISEACGNNLLDPGEACDDNNNVDGDGCSADCLSDETCGNGRVDTITGEACDDGDMASDDGCSSTCTVEFGFDCVGTDPTICSSDCGDGEKAADEDCDDGDTSDGDGCSATCQVEFGFSCSGTQPTSCSASCGDGEKASTEACDDGDMDDGDGCSSGCLEELGYDCTGTAPSNCTTTCGDGEKANVEACDDGDNDDDDGCSAGCTVEFGFACAGTTPTTCNSSCGDGLKAADEACDDGDMAGLDGCSASCTIESGYYCTGIQPSACCRNGWEGAGCQTPNCDSAPDIGWNSLLSSLNSTYTCSGCHGAGGFIDLTTSANAHTTLVNATAICDGSLTRVVPNDPAGSFIMDKVVKDAVDICGNSMPANALATMSFDDQDAIRRWICNGAEND